MQPSQKIIAVIGMHRSGTSAMTRALGFAGAALGGDFIETLPEVNAKGFWEDATLNAINIEVLRALGMDWLSNRVIAPHRFDEEALVPLMEKAAGILRAKAAGPGMFAFKDPRTSILLPFWQRVFTLAGVEAAYLIALRHPSSVADSLHARNGFERIKSDILWLRYTVESIIRSAGAPRVLVDYDLLMDHPVEELRRIATALGLEAPAPEAEAEFASRFLAPELRHSLHQADGATLAQTGTLYSALRMAVKNRDSPDDAAIATAVTGASRFLGDLAPVLDYLDQLEYAVASAPDLLDCELPCLPTLRASFGKTAEPSPFVSALPVGEPRHWLARLLRPRG